MIRKVFSLLPVVLIAFGAAKAQGVHEPCATTEVNASYKQSFPEIANYEKQLKDFIAEGIKNMSFDDARSKGTAFGPDDILHIPIVVHVVHDYGNTDYVSDNDVFRLIDEINEVYLKQNSDTTNVIAPFKKYIGNPKVMFHLATKDPSGKPTTGITRRQSYLTNGGDDQAKFDQWDPASYLNIWTIQRIGRGISNGVVAAYATFPSSAAAFPYTDGIITSAGSIFSNKTIPHEIGHCLNLFHTWGNIQVATNCTGDDEVDDTPPNSGHFGNGDPYGNTANGNCNTASLYDTSCTNNLVSMSKILLDPTLSPAVDNAVKGFDYIPRTNLTLESIKIYPSAIGQEFEISNLKMNGNNGSFSVVNVLNTKTGNVGKTTLGSSMIVNNWGSDSAIAKTGVTFNTLKYIWIDSFKIYPDVIGAPFTIHLLRQNGDTLKSYSGVTNTNSGAQNVPFSVFIPNGNGYKLQMVNNPGLKCDSLTTTSLAAINNNLTGVITFDAFVDTTNAEPGSSSTAYKGRYNFFYDWSLRYDALTTTDSGAQVVNLGFKVLPDTTFRLSLTKNPGVFNDQIGIAPYVKNIPCVFDIFNDTTGGRYNLLYDLKVRYGYIKNCIDYPDTVNTQNIMDYANCPIMFTNLQVTRMRTALASNIGNRNSLVNDTTHVRTGILDRIGGTYGIRYDLKPIPDVSVERGTGLSSDRNYFLCAGREFVFRQRSWRDTITSVDMSFNKGAREATISRNGVGLSSDFRNTFSETGWADVTVKAAGNGSGDSTIEFKSLVYVADSVNKTNPNNGFYMEFSKEDANNPLDKWPMFNYYNNDNKWAISENVGFWDNSSIVYKGFDKRSGPASYNGTPKGDFDDFFTPAFDLSGMTNGECRLNFMSSGAFRINDSRLMKDTLQISYSLDCGANWTTLAFLGKTELANKGVVSVEYAPLYWGDWALKSFEIPQAARTDKVFFRFRFRPGVDDVSNNGITARVLPGTGNNYFIDRINISPYKLGVNTLLTGDKNVALAPNPTNGSSQLIIKSASRENAKVIVTDIAGKVVYTTQQQLNGTITAIEIPASVISVKGMYMVQVFAGYERYTEKLVSY